jgi:hypothetical protein
LVVTAFAPLAAAEPASTALPSIAIPDTAAGEQLTWTLAQVNGGAGKLKESEVEDHVAPDFLAGLSAANLISILQDLTGPSAPWTVARFEGGASDTRANALLFTADGNQWRIRLGVEAKAPHRINDLFFEPAPAPEPLERPRSWKGLDSYLKRVAPKVGFVAAEVSGGGCQPLFTLNPNRELAVASAFKLYVLGAVADAVAAGEIGWDDALAIQSDLKSLPNGDLRLEPAGSRFPVRAYADQMMANSDNTATDHLIALLGRERVEAFMAEMGHSAPERNQPLLLTREWFALKLRYSEEALDEFTGASDAEQRAFLREDVDPVAATLYDDEVWVGPNEIETIEWFASAGDLCRALAVLQSQAEKPGMTPVYDALSLNPGVAWDARTWRYVGFKEGYETGVKAYAWLLQRADGRWFAVTAIINDPKQEIDGYTLRQYAVTAVDLLAKVE